MRAHTPPFTKPEAAYDSRRLYEETSAIAAAQDAKHAMTDAERESKLRTVAHYIYHAKLLMDEVFGEDRQRRKGALRDMVRESERLDLYSNADTPAKSPHGDFTIAQDPPDLPMGWLARGGVPAESAYLASFGMDGSRIATEAEVASLREHLTAEQLRECGIGDVEPATLRGIPSCFIDSHGNWITRRHVRYAEHSATPAENVRHNAHPMAAETIRDHDERLFGGEDRL